MAITPARKLLLGFLTAMAVAGLGATALAAPQDSPATPRAASEMPTLVEDFAYPGADKLLQERGITLKRGDGHIILTPITDVNECVSDTANLMVESHKGKFCFRSNAKSGYLTLELPDSFNIWTGAQPVKATLTADGKNTVVNAPANDLTGVGESGDTGVRSVLVELRISA
ncbi:hypothetical protein [Streptomyces sp. NPDC016845]|uniref:hypothetical protein n=1 Tax=Streptomyces sp. NPDC016845 TaxID=3364972 RepID=UPI0037880C2F